MSRASVFQVLNELLKEKIHFKDIEQKSDFKILFLQVYMPTLPRGNTDIESTLKTQSFEHYLIITTSAIPRSLLYK